ncbi:Nramp family divalent metal transporter [soil metagenome]
MLQRIKELGPGVLIAAAFIGPGTVTVCTIAGASYGYTLLWAMALSIGATLLLQEMAARMGLISRQDLSSLIRIHLKIPFLRIFSIILILTAIVMGNAAYEAGNISGGVIGLSVILPEATVLIGNFTFNYLSLIVGVIAFLILFLGNYRIIEKGLISLVILMTLSFVITAFMTQPDFLLILKGLFIPQIPDNNFLIVMGLIGTTVVPYNLFLHTSLVQERWKSKADLKTAQFDSFISITLGGIVSLAIIVAAAAMENKEINNAADLARGLEPLYGQYATHFMALGMFAAGITSAITAPFAAAYVVNGCLKWNAPLKSARFRAVWIFVLFSGIFFSSLNIRPIQIIMFAQIANGILLPVITFFLIWISSKRSILGEDKNSTIQNFLGILVFILTLILGIRSIWTIVVSLN